MILKLAAFLTTILFSQTIYSADVTAKSWLVADESGQIIDSRNPDDIRPIASITKLLTAMVVLDAGQSQSEMIPLSHRLSDAFPRDKSLTRKEVLYLSLVKSDNRAAQTLCEQYTGGFDACIAAMNNKLMSLGMTNSRVVEPTGLDARNVSTSSDLVKLVLAAKHYPDIVDASQTPSVDIRTPVRQKVKHGKKRRWIVVDRVLAFHNTNPLVRRGSETVQVSKTGFTSVAGGCIALLMNNRVVIVLGSRNTRTRIPEARQLSYI